MTWSFVLRQDLWPALVSVALTIILGTYSWVRRNVPGAKAFAIGCLFAMLWSVGSSLGIAASDFADKVFWLKFHALWQLPTVTALSCFFLEYAGLGRFLTRRNIILFSIPALITFILMVTNEYHQLIWTSFSMDDQIRVTYGPATWASIWYANLLGLINLLALLRLAIRSPRSRWPVAIMLLGQLSGRVMYVLDALFDQVFSPGESTLVVIGLSCSVYAFALFHYRVLDPRQLARSVAIEQMSDGMLVLNLQGQIIDINPAAAAILSRSASDLFGKHLAEVMPVNSGIIAAAGKIELTKTEFCLGSGDKTRYFNLSLTTLIDKQGEALGHLLLFHDTTGQRHAQNLLMEQQRVVATLQERERLARELHDSIGQILGYISMQAQAARKWVETRQHSQAEPILNRLAEVAQEAHADVRESIISLRCGGTPDWQFLDALRKYLDHYQSSFDIITDLHLPEQLNEDAFSPDIGIQIMRVIQETLSNARKHSGAHRVKITFIRDNSHFRIRIDDDGCGFDMAGINHQNGQHYGLTFMRERMEQIGGSITINSEVGSGTNVVLNIPGNT